MSKQTVEQSVELYFKAWNTKGAENIIAILEKCWTADGLYSDPTRPSQRGLSAIAGVIQDSQEKFAGRTVTQTSEADAYNNSGRYEWMLARADGAKTVGLDYFEFNADHLITRVVSFFGAVSPK